MILRSPSGAAAALLAQQLLGAADADLDAEHVGVQSQRAAPPFDRLGVLAELEVDLAVARERAEMLRVALQHFVAVGKRPAVLARQIENGGALVPALGEVGPPANDLG